MRKFATADIVSAATGIMCSRSMDDIYQIMNYLTGDNLFTHQLPRALRVCKEHVKKQCPWVDTLDPTAITVDNYEQWRRAADLKVGAEHELQPLPPGVWESKDPIQELKDMGASEDRIIQVEVDNDSDQ